MSLANHFKVDYLNRLNAVNKRLHEWEAVKVLGSDNAGAAIAAVQMDIRLYRGFVARDVAPWFEVSQ